MRILLKILLITANVFSGYPMFNNARISLYKMSSLKQNQNTEGSIYSLEDATHDIEGYLNSILINNQNTVLAFDAPTLVYKSESHRYIQDEVENTITHEITYENNYDLWSNTYNTQAYVSDSSILLEGYYGDTYVKDISYSISGTKKDNTHYYLKALSVSPIDSLTNVNHIRITVQECNYSSNVSLSTHQEERTVHIEGDSYTDTQEVTNNIRFRSRSSVALEQRFDFESGYYIDAADVSIEVPISLQLQGVTIDNYDGYGIVTAQYYSTVTRLCDYTLTTTATIKCDAGDQDVLFNITSPTGPVIISSSSPITLESKVDWFGKHFLDTINCSGKGDNSDKEMIISKWSSLESYFLNLPSENKQRILSGDTSKDAYLSEAFIRYDYCLFFKNYPLNDFLSRKDLATRYYQNKGPSFSFFDDKYINLVVIVTSSIFSLFTTGVFIYLLRKKNTSQLK